MSIPSDNLPEQIPFFYTLMLSVMKDMASLGDGTYASLDLNVLDVLLRIYRDTRRSLQTLATLGEVTRQEIERLYG